MSDSVRRALRLVVQRFKSNNANNNTNTTNSNTSSNSSNPSTSINNNDTDNSNDSEQTELPLIDDPEVASRTSHLSLQETPETSQPSSASTSTLTACHVSPNVIPAQDEAENGPATSNSSSQQLDPSPDSTSTTSSASSTDTGVSTSESLPSPSPGTPPPPPPAAASNGADPSSPPPRTVSLTMNLTLNIRTAPRVSVDANLQQGIAGPAATGAAATGGGTAHPTQLLTLTMDETGAILGAHQGLAGVAGAAGRVNATAAAAAAAAFFNPALGDPHLFTRARHRMYSLLLLRAAMAYFLTIPNIFRRALEWAVLLCALLSFALLIHLHVIFIRSPLTCLDGIQEHWPRHGILRLQIDPYRDPTGGSLSPGSSSLGSKTDDSMDRLEATLYNLSSPATPLPITLQQYRLQVVAQAILQSAHGGEPFPGKGPVKANFPPVYLGALLNDSSLQEETSLRTIEFYPKKHGVWPQPYMVEYSLEYGLLRLSEEMRLHYSVPVMTKTLYPEKDACFGDPLARFMLAHFLGYDDVLIGSIKRLAEAENNRGYVRNVATGEHFRFVNVWMTRASYIMAAFIMVIFTLFISMLIRYSHQQVFFFVSEFLRTVEMQRPFNQVTMLGASLITVVLALIGMEALMYEFFSDSSIAFHVIIMVWAADQFHSMAIRSPVSKRHFLRFFYLYQFLFYAYHYRFNGQYAGLALLTTMLFTYHAMIAFFHRFELPLVQQMEEAMRERDRENRPAPRDRSRSRSRREGSSEGVSSSTNSTTASSQSSRESSAGQTNSESTSNVNGNSTLPSNGNAPSTGPSSDHGDGGHSHSHSAGHQHLHHHHHHHHHPPPPPTNTTTQADPSPPSGGGAMSHHHHFTIRHHICRHRVGPSTGTPSLVVYHGAGNSTSVSVIAPSEAEPGTTTTTTATTEGTPISLIDLEID